MEEKEFDPTLNAEENTEESGDIDTVSGDVAQKEPLWVRICEKLPRIAIWARYLLPFISLLTLFVMSFFYNVQIYGSGKLQELSVFRLYVNTFKGMHNYFGGNTVAGRSWFYSIVTVGAVVGILIFLVALFLAGLASYTAVRAFLAGHESEESDRMKLIFKIAFPNRVWLFLSELLILLPMTYPHFFSLVSRNFLAISGEEVIFVLLNRPLIVGAILTVLTLVLALLIPKYERRKKMNMFLLRRTQQTDDETEQTEKESE